MCGRAVCMRGPCGSRFTRSFQRGAATHGGQPHASTDLEGAGAKLGSLVETIRPRPGIPGRGLIVAAAAEAGPPQIRPAGEAAAAGLAA